MPNRPHNVKKKENIKDIRIPVQNEESPIIKQLPNQEVIGLS